jgi:hypothetical protein
MTRALICAAVATAACGATDATPDAAADAANAAASDATTDAAACARSPGTPTAVGAITGVPSTELSGLAASRTIADLLWTHGDHGGAAEIYAIRATNAVPTGTLQLAGATAIDWEDIAAAPCPAGHCLYIADTGDNDLDRASVALYEVVEPTSAPLGALAVDYARYDIEYPDGPHDVEAIFVDPRDGKSYAIAKTTTPPAGVYALPRIAGATGLAQPVAELAIPDADPRITAADLTIDDCATRLAVRTYGSLYELRAAPTASIPELLASRLTPLPVAAEPHGEAVAYAADGRAYYTTSEGPTPLLYRAAD